MKIAALQLMLRRGQLQDAEAYCYELLSANPLFVAVHPYLFQLLFTQRRFTELLTIARQVSSQQADFLPAWQAQLHCLRQLQQHQDALALIEELLQKHPDQTSLLMQKAILLKDTGQTSHALDCLQHLIRLQPELYEAYWLRADLLKAPTDHDIKAMQQLVPQCSTDNGRAQLHFAIARAFEQQKNYRASFEQLQLGATAKKRSLKYNHQAELAEYIAIMQQFHQPLPAADPVFSGSIPIFICGLPRSGTTLVEQILSSHADVTAGDELFDLAHATDAALTPQQKQQPFPQWVDSATPTQWQNIAHGYLRLTQRLQQTTYFTDKMPLNYKAIGVIKAALPQAKIIYCQRHPMDTLFSCYKQLFADGIAFSYDLNELCDIYIAQQQLMMHWQRLFPGQIHTVRYEQLIEQQQQQTQALLKYVDLPWSESCMQFYRNSRAVFTISNTQVRQPLFRSSMGHWQHYNQQLLPVLQRLQPYIEQYQTDLCKNR